MAGFGAGSPRGCSTVCCATWPACGGERAGGRKRPLRLCIVDTQSVKCIPIRGLRGFDAGKKVLGHKRVALIDADGNWLTMAVVPASVQDRDTLPALDAGKVGWPGCAV